MVYDAAKKVSGAAGPSGADVDLWTRLLCSKQFKKKPAELGTDDEVIYSQEGTTQGGPESMGFYAVSMKSLTKPEPNIKKLFYADDGSAGGKILRLAEHWKSLNIDGPPNGYFPNSTRRCWLRSLSIISLQLKSFLTSK